MNVNFCFKTRNSSRTRIHQQIHKTRQKIRNKTESFVCYIDECHQSFPNDNELEEHEINGQKKFFDD